MGNINKWKYPSKKWMEVIIWKCLTCLVSVNRKLSTDFLCPPTPILIINSVTVCLVSQTATRFGSLFPDQWGSEPPVCSEGYCMVTWPHLLERYKSSMLLSPLWDPAWTSLWNLWSHFTMFLWVWLFSNSKLTIRCSAQMLHLHVIFFLQ